MNTLTIQPGQSRHIEGILALLPRLADFEVPTHRNPIELWHGDAQMLKAWAQTLREDLHVIVAVDEYDTVVGVAAASEREDLLSHAPSAHLEVLVVAESAAGQGLGKQLLSHIEQALRDKGLNGISLHVFGNNHRARALYQRQGFQEEIVRCFKPFD